MSSVGGAKGKEKGAKIRVKVFFKPYDRRMTGNLLNCDPENSRHEHVGHGDAGN